MKTVCFSFFLVFLCTVSSFSQKLVWSDEFNQPGSPDSTKWSYDLGVGNPSGWGNNELQCYTNERKNSWIENGRLIIEARKDEQQGKPYTSARLVTRKKGDWLYGKVEVRAKLPYGKGTWPAIWMLSTDWRYGGWPESGEIDIMEHVGYDMGVVHGTIHTFSYNHTKQTQKEGKINVTAPNEDFHVYGLEWTKDKMDFIVDGKVYHSVIRGAQDGWKEWPFDQPFHLILNVAVGGNWGGSQGVDEKIWPQRMEVDYIRIYQ